MLGNIFKNKFKIDPLNIDLMEIEKIAIKKVSFLKYAEKLVSKRGNIFKNNFYNIDKRFDSKLASYTS
jgi:hypothetical protein